MRIPVPLNALRAFEVAARHLSIKDAALELAVTPRRSATSCARWRTCSASNCCAASVRGWN